MGSCHVPNYTLSICLPRDNNQYRLPRISDEPTRCVARYFLDANPVQAQAVEKGEVSIDK